jgi:hypothetical protein
MRCLLLRGKANDFPLASKTRDGCNEGEAFMFEASDQGGDLDGTIR